MKEQFLEAKQLLEKSQKILIISHRKPDADTLGAALCLRFYLEKFGKKITLACIDKPPAVFNFLPGVGDYVDNFNLDEFELVIIVDAGASYMTNFHLKYEDLFKGKVPILNIDHHASNDNFGQVNIVDPAASSATVVLYRMLKEFGAEIDANMATCLLAGIYADTGCFMHSNTNKEVYEIAADLMRKGAEVTALIKELFKTREVGALKLWGKVLEKAQITDDKVVISVMKDQDFENIKSGPDSLSGVIDYLNMVPDTKFALLIHEDRKGNVKGSFRTRNDDVDLSRIAAVFGGGGHPKASGFMMSGKIKEELHYAIVSDESKKPLEF